MSKAEKIGASQLRRYVIERNMPGIGTMTAHQLAEAAAKSNDALASLARSVQWVQSFVAKDKTFCIYLAENEAAVRERARVSGLPADTVTEAPGILDPVTASGR